jgi:hypothetical protein
MIIKPADKGSAVVVMDKTTYLQEAERQLSDCRFYEKFDSDPTLDSCSNSVIMGNVRVTGSYIHGNKRGIFWNG